MFLATVDKKKRLLYLVYVGQVMAQELRKAREEFDELVGEIPTGSLRVLADFGRLGSMDAECVAELGKLMELCDVKGVEIVVRVVPDSSKDVGLNILAAFHYRTPLQTVTCQSMEEAAKALGI